MKEQPIDVKAKQKLKILIKTGQAVNFWKKQTKKSKIRYYSLNELVSTQSDYLRDLRLIKQKMQIPLRQSGLISEQKQNKIFSSLDGLIHLSVNLLQDCIKIKDEWNLHTSMLGPTMIYYSKFLLVYSEFLQAYKSNLDELLLLVENYQAAREIENKISSEEGKVITFQNLWSKPFQRTMKYKLILKQYHDNLFKSHPDYLNLLKAISKYEEVSQRNNQSLQKKQKNKTLLRLESKYGEIINEDAKNYIDSMDATMIDIKVKCYVFSNMIMVVNIEEAEEVELVRVILNQTSFVTILKDIHYFKNRLFICGKRKSIHLTFETQQNLQHCYQCLKSIIFQLYSAQYTRRELSKTSFRQTALRQTVLQARVSYTQLKQKLHLSPRFFVIGHVKRYFSYAKLKIYYIIKFVLPVGYDNNSILYVEQQKLLTLQKIMRNLYEAQLKNVPIIENPSKTMSSSDIKGIDMKALEYKGINATIFLNFIFRDSQILKRIDIAAHILTINEPMWIFCKYIDEKCSCNLCVNGEVINKIEDYQFQTHNRNKNRIFKYKFYCPFRTVHTQNMLAQIKKQSIVNSIDRLFLLKCQKCELDYRIADSPPLYIIKKQIQISFDRLQPLMKLQLIIDHQQRIGQIISAIQDLYRIRLDDYQMFMRIHTKSYQLGRDQILWNILQEQVREQQSSFISFFRTTFRQKEDLNIKLCLKKIWLLEQQYQKLNDNQVKKQTYLIEQFMVRISRHQITLDMNQLATFYAIYFVLKTTEKKQNQQVTNQNLKAILLQKWNVLEKKHKTAILQAITQKVYFLRNKHYKKDELILRICDYINVIGNKRPGWSAFMFNAEIISFPNYCRGTKATVGADIFKFYIKSDQKMNILFECSLEQAFHKVLISGFQLRIKHKDDTYIITGDDLFNLQNIIESYLLYKKIFNS